MTEFTRILAVNTHIQFFFVITTAVICYSQQYLQQVNVKWQYDDIGSSNFLRVAKRSDGCSGEKLLAPSARKKRLRRKMTNGYY